VQYGERWHSLVIGVVQTMSTESDDATKVVLGGQSTVEKEDSEEGHGGFLLLRCGMAFKQKLKMEGWGFWSD
jgi:hypothetical protein